MPEGLPEGELLARLASGACRSRDDLRGASNREGGSGGNLGYFLEIGSEFLKASRHRRYATPELALECEWDREMLRRRLGIYPPDRVWFLSLGADSAFWACSLTPRLPVLRDAFNEAEGNELGWEPWKNYLEAFRITFELAVERNTLLDCNPNNFAIADGQLYYIDDDLVDGSGRIPFGHQALLRLREYPDSPLRHRVQFLSEFAGLVEQLPTGAALRQTLVEDLQQRITWPEERELRAILDGLVEHLSPPAREF